MAINFPTGLDSFPDPTPTSEMSSPSHSGLHVDVNSAVEALQAKVGVNGSTVATSLDYKVTNGIHNALNVDSGVLFVDAANNRVGVNTTSPTEALQVQGTIKQVNGGSGDYSYMTLSTSGLSLTGDNTDSLSASPSTLTITSNDLQNVHTINSSSISMTNYTSGNVTQIDNDGNITFAGILSGGTINSLKEKWYTTINAPSGNVNVDVGVSSAWYSTLNATGNFTLRIRYDTFTTLSSKMDVDESITVVFANTNGTTPYYPSVFQIDGVTQTPKWQGGTAPTGGNASSVDVYVYTIIKTSSTPTYAVFASQTRFA